MDDNEFRALGMRVGDLIRVVFSNQESLAFFTVVKEVRGDGVSGYWCVSEKTARRESDSSPTMHYVDEFVSIEVLSRQNLGTFYCYQCPACGASYCIESPDKGSAPFRLGLFLGGLMSENWDESMCCDAFNFPNWDNEVVLEMKDDYDGPVCPRSGEPGKKPPHFEPPGRMDFVIGDV